MKMKLYSLAIIPFLVFCSCATMFSDKIVKFPVTSNPDGAIITAYSEQGIKVFEGTTPCTIEIEKAKLTNGKIVIEKAGYKTVEFKPGKSIEPTALLNACCFFPIGTGIGALIDYNNGSMFRTETEKLDVILESAGSSVQNGDTMTFTVAAADGTSTTTRFSLQIKGELVYMTIEEVL